MTLGIRDEWSALAYIPGMDGRSQPPGASWVPEQDSRRLYAYQILAAYISNTRRYLGKGGVQYARLVSDGGIEQYARVDNVDYSQREYGDADLLVETATGLVLGDSQDVEFPQGEDSEAEQWLRAWWSAERGPLKLSEGERYSCGQGDAVYVLVPSAAKQRPRLQVYDPGFYFPDWEAAEAQGWGADEDYPPTVHLAWEWTDSDGKVWVRRSTWTLQPLETPEANAWGGISSQTCFYRMVDYRLADLLENATVYSPEISREAGTRVLQDWTDLGIDFIPVVHVPNSPGEWGQSILLSVGQVLEDIQNADSDLAVNKDVAASPLLATDGPAENLLTGEPGTHLGGAGNVRWVDTSKNLDALAKYLDLVLGRLMVNSRLGDVLTGRVTPSEAPSGFALSLGFHPARRLMQKLRLVREAKYPLILRFALRMAQAYGWTPAGETPDGRIALGPALPTDLSEAIANVTGLLENRAISTSTAVRQLISAGLPIEDAEDEVAQIREEDPARAVQMVEATGDIEAARQWLGLGPGTIVVPPVNQGE